VSRLAHDGSRFIAVCAIAHLVTVTPAAQSRQATTEATPVVSVVQAVDDAVLKLSEPDFVVCVAFMFSPTIGIELARVVTQPPEASQGWNIPEDAARNATRNPSTTPHSPEVRACTNRSVSGVRELTAPDTDPRPTPITLSVI